jgi:hypothetical protein
MKQLESKLQQACVKWFRMQYQDLLLFAVPNGGSRNALEAAKMKREGVTAGVADLCLLKFKREIVGGIEFTKYHGLFIEMKYGKGVQSYSQKEFEAYCTKHGYKYVVCRTFDEFRATIENYLKEY